MQITPEAKKLEKELYEIGKEVLDTKNFLHLSSLTYRDFDDFVSYVENLKGAELETFLYSIIEFHKSLDCRLDCIFEKINDIQND